MVAALEQRAKQERYQILRTVVWIERWIEVSVICGGVVVRISRTDVSGSRGIGNAHSRWNVLTVALAENCECGPLSRSASPAPRTCASVPEGQSIPADCCNGNTQA